MTRRENALSGPRDFPCAIHRHLNSIYDFRQCVVPLAALGVPLEYTYPLFEDLRLGTIVVNQALRIMWFVGKTEILCNLLRELRVMSEEYDS